MQIPLLPLLLWFGSTDGGAAGRVAFTVLVTAEDGRAVPGETVVAVDEAREVMVGVARSDQAGRAEMILPDRRTVFTVMSVRYQVGVVLVRDARNQILRLRPLPAPSGPGPVNAPVVRTRPPLLIRGRVVDERGLGLPSVRVDAVRATEWTKTAAGARAKGVVIASAMSDAGGSFTLPIPAGDTQIQPRAAGLVLVRSTTMTEGGRARADRPILVMGAVADSEASERGQAGP